MTRFAHFHHLFVAELGFAALLLFCVPIAVKFRDWFEALVERMDWRRVDRFLHRAMVYAVVAAAFIFLASLASAIERVF